MRRFIFLSNIIVYRNFKRGHPICAGRHNLDETKFDYFIHKALRVIVMVTYLKLSWAISNREVSVTTKSAQRLASLCRFSNRSER